MARHVDFDADWDRFARSQSGPTITIYGAEHVLPVSAPVAVVLMRWKLITDPESVTLDQILDVLRLLFGDTVERWVDDGIERMRLYHLIITVAAMWDPEPDEGEAQPPATGATTDPSSPTSSTAGTTS